MFSRQHAIVLGGGFGGLLMSKVLSDFFAKVTVIEQDTKPSTYQVREGAPQGGHLHILTSTGAEILETMFPQLAKNIVNKGGHRVDITDSWQFCIAGCKPLTKSNHFSYLVTRPFLEQELRNIVSDLPNIEFLYEHHADGLLANFIENRINGVRISNNKTNECRNVYGNLIIDTTGRYTRAPQWLEALEYPLVPKTEVPVNIRYLSRQFRLPKAQTPKWSAILIKGVAPCKKTATMMLIEDNKEDSRWLVTLAGQHGDHAIATDQGFLDFAQQLTVPDLYSVLKEAEPISPFLSFEFPAIRRFNYEQIQQHLPKGFVPVGDSVCSLSPVFGLGMTTCALQANVLKGLLQHEDEDYLTTIKNDYYNHTKKILDNAWVLNVDPEYLFTEVPGKRPFGIYTVAQYRKNMLLLCNQDKKIWRKVFEVISLRKPYRHLFKPSIFLPVLWYALLRKLSLTK